MFFKDFMHYKFLVDILVVKHVKKVSQRLGGGAIAHVAPPWLRLWLGRTQALSAIEVANVLLSPSDGRTDLLPGEHLVCILPITSADRFRGVPNIKKWSSNDP